MNFLFDAEVKLKMYRDIGWFSELFHASEIFMFDEFT